MEHLKLNQHKFKKGKFISPWNDMDFKMTQNPWFQNRLPEYLWLALILNKYDRKKGLDICNSIMLFAKELKIVYDIHMLNYTVIRSKGVLL